MELNSNIFLTGHNGMLGRAIHRSLIRKNYKNLEKCSCKGPCQRSFKNSSKYHKIKAPMKGALIY